MEIMELPKYYSQGIGKSNQKPLGHVKIDRGNKFGRHVARAINPVNTIVDEVSGQFNKIGVATVERGVADFKDDGNANYYEERGGLFTPGPEMTLLARVRTPDIVSLNGLYGNKVASNWSDDEGFTFNPREGKVFLKVGTAEAITNIAFAANEWVNIAGYYKASELLTASVNGVDPGYSIQDTASASLLESTKPLRLGTYHSASASLSFEGDMQFLTVLNKRLSIVESEEYFRDPYQIFKPAMKLFYFPPEVAVVVPPSSGGIVRSVVQPVVRSVVQPVVGYRP